MTPLSSGLAQDIPLPRHRRRLGGRRHALLQAQPRLRRQRRRDGPVLLRRQPRGQLQAHAPGRVRQQVLPHLLRGGDQRGQALLQQAGVWLVAQDDQQLAELPRLGAGALGGCQGEEVPRQLQLLLGAPLPDARPLAL